MKNEDYEDDVNLQQIRNGVLKGSQWDKKEKRVMISVDLSKIWRFFKRKK